MAPHIMCMKMCTWLAVAGSLKRVAIILIITTAQMVTGWVGSDTNLS